MHGASKVGGAISGRGGGDLGWGGEQVLFEGTIGGDIRVCGGGSITPRWVISRLVSECGVGTWNVRNPGAVATGGILVGSVC